MTYLSGNFGRRKSYRKYIFFVLFFIIIFFSWNTLRSAFFPLLEPVIVSYGETKHESSRIPQFMGAYITSRQALVVQNNTLMKEVERLENEIASKDALLREYGERESLSTSTPGHVSALVMYPLMQDVTSLYSSIILSKGFKDGVTSNAQVFVRGNQLVCLIKEVYTATSLCGLISASGVRTEGVTSSSSVALTLVGRGGHFIADITRDTPVSVGERVYLRDNPHMILGVVKEVMNNNQDTSWHVFVEGAYNPVTSSIFYVQPQ